MPTGNVQRLHPLDSAMRRPHRMSAHRPICAPELPRSWLPRLLFGDIHCKSPISCQIKSIRGMLKKRDFNASARALCFLAEKPTLDPDSMTRTFVKPSACETRWERPCSRNLYTSLNIIRLRNHHTINVVHGHQLTFSPAASHQAFPLMCSSLLLGRRSGGK
jgi:hypothetical protein